MALLDDIMAAQAENGIYNNYDIGSNGWGVYNGKTYIFSPNAKVPPDVVAQYPIASGQEFYNLTSPNAPGNGNGAGGLGSVLTDPDSLKLLGVMAGGIGAAGGFGSLFGGATPAASSGGLVSSPWAATAPGIGASPLTGMAGSVLDTVAPAATGWGSGIGAGTAAAGAGAGGSMSGVFDLLDGGGVDMTGFMGNGPVDPWGAGSPVLGSADPYGSLGGLNYGSVGADPYGLGWGPMTATGNASWDALLSGGANLPAGGPWNDYSLNPYGSGLSTGLNVPSALKQLLSGPTGSAKGVGGLFNPDGSLNLGALGSLAGSALPGIAALTYANSQPGINVSPLTSTIDQIGGMNADSQQSVLQRMQDAGASQAANAPLFVQAAVDPVQRNIAAGYGALQQSQALRGLGGSSFGDTSLANYMDQGNRTLANAGATAAQAAGQLQNQNLGLQGTLSSGIYNSQLARLLGQGGLQQQVISLQNQAQKNKNDLFGRAFSAFGRSAGGGGLGNGLNLSALGLP